MTTHTYNGGNLGQAPFVPTDEQRAMVREYVAVGLVRKQIALLIKHPDGRPICVKTLNNHFQKEMELGGLEAIAKVGGALFRGAMAGNPALIRIYMNTHAHRFGLPTEKRRHEHTGADGGPIQSVDWSAIIEATPEEARPALMAQIEKLLAETVESEEDDNDITDPAE